MAILILCQWCYKHIRVNMHTHHPWRQDTKVWNLMEENERDLGYGKVSSPSMHHCIVLMDGWMDERCFRPLLCTVKAELGRGQPGLMRWIWDETLPQSSIDRSTFYSAAHRATKWASGHHCIVLIWSVFLSLLLIIQNTAYRWSLALCVYLPVNEEHCTGIIANPTDPVTSTQISNHPLSWSVIATWPIQHCDAIHHRMQQTNLIME